MAINRWNTRPEVIPQSWNNLFEIAIGNLSIPRAGKMHHAIPADHRAASERDLEPWPAQEHLCEVLIDDVTHEVQADVVLRPSHPAWA